MLYPIFGLITLALSIISFLLPIPRLIIEIFLILAGILLIIDSIRIKHGKLLSLIAGIIAVLIAVIPILNDFSLLSFLPFVVILSLNAVLLKILLIFISIYLITDKFL